MILSKEFYDKCDPSYKKVIDELEQKLAEIQAQDDVDEKTKEQQAQSSILNFSRSFLTPNEYWKYYKSFFSFINLNSVKFYKICAQAYLHLYYDNEMELPNNFGDLNYADLKLIDFQFKKYIRAFVAVDEEEFDYPHFCLKDCFRIYESNLSCLPHKTVVQRYQKMRALYVKIKAAEKDVDTWFKLLLEVNDFAFVKHNVEYRLGQSLLDVKLWKLYIRYLKEHGEHKLLLEIYSKYCRFFLDDHEMLEEYKEAMIKYGPIELQWNNLFDFEVKKGCIENHLMIEGGENIYDDETTDEEESGNSDFEMEESSSPLDKNTCAVFYDTYQIQNFSFHGSSIFYILNNANHQVLRKLFLTCKYFFKNMPTPICYRLKTKSTTLFNNECLSLRRSTDLEYLANAFVTTSIDITSFKIEIATLISRIYRCEAKYINIFYQKLSFDELKFFIEHGGVVKLCLVEGTFKDENNEFVDFEKIMEYLPNIEDIHLDQVKFNSNTPYALKKQRFNNKICNIFLQKIYGEPFDLYEFLQFCIAHRDDRFYSFFCFEKNYTLDFVKKFKEMMKNYEKSCENTEIVSYKY